MIYAGFSEKQHHVINAPMNLTDHEMADLALCLEPFAWFHLARLSAKFSLDFWLNFSLFTNRDWTISNQKAVGTLGKEDTQCEAGYLPLKTIANHEKLSHKLSLFGAWMAGEQSEWKR